jgi:hypothetical protein
MNIAFICRSSTKNIQAPHMHFIRCVPSYPVINLTIVVGLCYLFCRV